MYSLVVQGGRPLHGEVQISGAKNAVLPIMAATLLTREPCVIRRAPELSDVAFMGRVLASVGEVRVQGDTVSVEAARIKGFGITHLVRRMRGSICILGPLLGRLRQADVSFPGGCVFGPRPIDLHLKGMRALGAAVTVEKGYVRAKAKRLVGTSMFLGDGPAPPCWARRT